jgi:hypothetical protein
MLIETYSFLVRSWSSDKIGDTWGCDKRKFYEYSKLYDYLLIIINN